MSGTIVYKKAKPVLLFRNKLHSIQTLTPDAEYLIFHCGKRLKIDKSFANYGKPTCKKCLAATVLERMGV